MPSTGSRRHGLTSHRLRRGLLLPRRIGDMHGWERWPLDITSVALLGAKLTFGPGDLAAGERDHRRAAASKTLEHIVVDAAYLAFGGDGLGCRWIPHHKVGVRAHIDAPLPRIDVED